MRAGVDDPVGDVILGPVGTAWTARIHPELEYEHPRQTELIAQPPDGGRDHPQILGDQWQLGPERAPERIKQRPPRTPPPSPGGRSPRSGGDRPVRDETAEVVDPREVEQLQRALHAVHPPAVAGALKRGPVIQRVAPELAADRVFIGRRTGHEPLLKEARMGQVIGARGRDVDRDVAHDPHAPLEPVGPQRPPFALEADLIGYRAAAREPLPVTDPEHADGHESPRSPRRTRALAAHAATPAKRRTPSSTCTASGTGRADRAAAPATRTGRRPRASR